VVRKWLYALAGSGLLVAGLVSASQAGQTAQAAHAVRLTAATTGAAAASGQAASTSNIYVTLYGWDDNSPPGCAIAYPQIHSCADGTGTYSDPITFATDASELAPGTIIYYAPLQRYFIMEDDCTECDQDWTSSGYSHIDLWAGGSAGDNANALYACEDQWTSDGQVPVIVNPPSDEPVANGGAGGSVFNSSTSSCWES
jgi:hypothetical protein